MNLTKLMAEYRNSNDTANYDEYMEGGTEFVRVFDQYYLKVSEQKKNLLDNAIMRGILLGLEFGKQSRKEIERE